MSVVKNSNKIIERRKIELYTNKYYYDYAHATLCNTFFVGMTIRNS